MCGTEQQECDGVDDCANGDDESDCVGSDCADLSKFTIIIALLDNVLLYKKNHS